MRRNTLFIALVAVAVGGLMVPASIVAQNAAHAHMGHVADGFRGTPDGMGLLPTAVAEIEVAVQHAGFAARDPMDLGGVQRHMPHVIHALDPSVVENGPGAGYGVKAAASGAVRHIEMAGGADGASENVQRHAPHVAAGAGNAAEWVDAAVALAQEIQDVSDAETAAQLLDELVETLDAIQNGRDGSGMDGWGLAQATQHMGFMKSGEGIG